MNKKLLYPAVISVAIQLLYMVLFFIFSTAGPYQMLVIFALFYVLAVPYTISWFFETFKHYDKRHKILHTLCVVLTLPLLFIGVYIAIEFFPVQHEPLTIEDSGRIHIYDTSGNELPLDTIPKLKVNDTIISQIKIDEISE